MGGSDGYLEPRVPVTSPEEERQRLLFDCLCDRRGAGTLEQLTALSDAEWAGLLDLAATLMVAPMLCHRLLSTEFKPALPEQIRQTVAAEQRHAALANLRLHASLAGVEKR
jgi:hypothetical protein